ncbi:MAG: phosphate signaling complex protein PhoU [Planctomycetota bacterium]
MTKHLRLDLENLEKRLLLLGARVEDAVRKSVLALRKGRKDLAEEVIRGDLEIDREEVALEDLCLKVLALHHPVANDLRFVAAILKINSDLERIGDLASNVSRRSLLLPQPLSAPAPPELEGLLENTVLMLREALDAFVQGDVRLARKVLAHDQKVNEAYRAIVDATVAQLKAHTTDVEVAILYMNAAKNLERIADHATNIAEDVVYIVEGEIIRHKAAKARLEGGTSPL